MLKIGLSTTYFHPSPDQREEGVDTNINVPLGIVLVVPVNICTVILWW